MPREDKHIYIYKNHCNFKILYMSTGSKYLSSKICYLAAAT